MPLLLLLCLLKTNMPLLLLCLHDTSMIQGDSETECLLEELDYGAFDDRVFLVKKLVAIFRIVVALTHNECARGCLPVGKTRKGSIWRVEFIIIMIIIFCEMHKIGLN
jgi:hypothetical protein